MFSIPKFIEFQNSITSFPKRLKIEESQVESLLPALESEALRFCVLICLTIGTGMRLGEVTGLEWKHVDLERGFLRVDQSAQYIAGQGIIIKDPKSSSSERNIALPAEVISLLREYKEKQKNYSKKRRQADWFFRHPDGRHMQPHLVSSWFSRFVKRKNLPHMRFHDLRHLSATLSLLAGISPTNVAAQLGHSKVSTTMNIYTHALRSVDNLAAEKLNEVITKIKGHLQLIKKMMMLLRTHLTQESRGHTRLPFQPRAIKIMKEGFL